MLCDVDETPRLAVLVQDGVRPFAFASSLLSVARPRTVLADICADRRDKTGFDCCRYALHCKRHKIYGFKFAARRDFMLRLHRNNTTEVHGACVGTSRMHELTEVQNETAIRCNAIETFVEREYVLILSLVQIKRPQPIRCCCLLCFRQLKLQVLVSGSRVVGRRSTHDSCSYINFVHNSDKGDG